MALLCIVMLFVTVQETKTQVISNSGAVMTVSAGAVVTTADVNNHTGEIANNGTMQLTGNWADTATYTPGSGTVEFTGSTNQTISKPGGETFNHLVAANTGSGSGFSVGINDNVTVNGNLTVKAGNFSFGTNAVHTLNVLGTLRASTGTIDMSTGTNIDHIMQLRGDSNTCNQLIADDQSIVEYLGGNNQQVFASANYRDIRFAGTGIKQLQGDVTAAGDNMYIATNVDANGHILFYNNSLGTVNRTAGAVVGNFQWNVANPSHDYLYPVGTFSYYDPMTMNFTNLTSGTLMASFQPADIGNAGLPLTDADGEEIYEQFTQGYWHLSPKNALNSNNYSLKLQADGFPTGANNLNAGSRIVKRTNSNPLILDGSNAPFVGPDIISRTGNSTLMNTTDIGIAKGRPKIIDQPRNDTVCQGADANFTINPSGMDLQPVQWYKYVPPADSVSLSTGNTLTIPNTTKTDSSTYYYCIVTDSSNNTHKSGQVVLIADPVPVVTFMPRFDTICNSTTTKTNLYSDVPKTTYNWIVPHGTSLNAFADSIKNVNITAQISQLLYDATYNYDSAIYRVTPKGPAPTYCIGHPDSAVVWVEPTPTVYSNPPNDTICNNVVTSLVLKSKNHPTHPIQFNYTVVNSSPDSVYISNKNSGRSRYLNNQSINELLQDTGLYAHKVTYEVTPYVVDNNNNMRCSGATYNINVWVEPTPRINVFLDDTIYCNDLPVLFKLNTPNMAMNTIKYNLFTSYNGVVSGPSAGNNRLINNFTDYILNSSANYQKVTYSFNPEILQNNGSYCGNGINKTLNVFVNPTPVITEQFGKQTYCDSAMAHFTVSMSNVVLGDKYYNVSPVYNSDSIMSSGIIPNGNYPVNTYTNTMVNYGTKFHTVDYMFSARIKNPTGKDSNYYCITTIVKKDSIDILPDAYVRSKLSKYIGGWNLRCNNTTTGDSIALKVYGGEVAKNVSQNLFQYKWYYKSSPTGTETLLPVETHPSVTKKAAGYYHVKILDTDSCTTERRDTLTQPPVLNVTTVVLDTLKCAGNHLKFKAIVSGGTSGYAYKWYSGSNVVSNNAILVDSLEGIYDITVNDTNICIAKNSQDMYATGNISIDLNPSVFGQSKLSFNNDIGLYNISCPGGFNGSFAPIVRDAPSNIGFNFMWQKILPDTTILIEQVDDNGNLDSLPIGDYMLTVISNKNPECLGLGEAVLVDPPPVIINKRISKYYNGLFNLPCDTSANGYIAISASGGLNNFSYLWSGNGISVSNSVDSIGNLNAGKYNFTLIDSALIFIGTSNYSSQQCIYKDSFILNKPLPLQLKDTVFSDFSGVNIACYNGENGSITAKLSGGLGDNIYHYNWFNVANGASLGTDSILNDRKAGTYSLNVAYGLGCNKTWDFTLNQPDSIQISIDSIKKYNSKYNVSCYDSANGEVYTTVKGGISWHNYTYAWAKASDTSVVINRTGLPTNLMGTVYNFTVTDTNNCSNMRKVSLLPPSPITDSIITFPLTCYSIKDGKAIVTNVNGGVSPYSYYWINNAATTDTIDSLPGGMYTITITDLNGCKHNDSDSVQQPTPLNVQAIVASNYNGSEIRCYGESNGSVMAKTKGSSGKYMYQWVKIDTLNNYTGNLPPAQTISQLPAGTYYVIVNDSINKRCNTTDSVVVTQPSPLKLAIITDNVECAGLDNGALTSVVNGGTRPYGFTWSNNAPDDSVASNLVAGNYSVTVKDVNKCSTDTSALVTQPDPIVISVDSSQTKPAYCPDMSNGELGVIANGGIEPYEYNWSNSLPAGSSVNNLFVGNYVLTVIDSNKCIKLDTLLVKATHKACLDAPKAFSPGAGINDTWNIVVGNPTVSSPLPLNLLYSRAVVEIYNRWGELVYRSEPGYPVEWNGTSNGKPLPVDSYYYSIDLNNGSDRFTGTVAIVRYK